MSQRLLCTIAAATLLLTSAACGGGDGGVGPGSGTLDVAGINATASEIQSILNQPLLNSLVAQGGGSGGLLSVAAPERTEQTLATTLARGPLSVRALVAPLRVSLRVSPPAPRLGVTIPDSLRGGTFVRNSNGDYVRNRARTGAPSNGVRIIIYSGAVPSMQEIGYADISDLGNVSTDRISVSMVSGGVTVIQYDEQLVTATQTTTVAGYIANGTRRITFNVIDALAATGPQAAERNVLTFAFAVPSANASVNAVFVAAGLTASDDALAVALTTGSNQLMVKAGTVLDKATGEYVPSDTARYSVNGSLFALGITPSSGFGPEKFVRPDGSPLPASDASALQRALASFTQLVGTFAFVLLVDSWLSSIGLV